MSCFLGGRRVSISGRGKWNKRKESRDGPFVVLNEISCLGRLLTPTSLKLPGGWSSAYQSSSVKCSPLLMLPFPPSPLLFNNAWLLRKPARTPGRCLPRMKGIKRFPERYLIAIFYRFSFSYESNLHRHIILSFYTRFFCKSDFFIESSIS